MSQERMKVFCVTTGKNIKSFYFEAKTLADRITTGLSVTPELEG